MKVKISEGSITFKISEDEMQQLLSNFSLETKVVIGQSTLCIIIDLNAREYVDAYEEGSLHLITGISETRLFMCTTQKEIQKLADMGKDRGGISMKSGNLEVILQIDVRNDRRPRKN